MTRSVTSSILVYRTNLKISSKGLILKKRTRIRVKMPKMLKKRITIRIIRMNGLENCPRNYLNVEVDRVR